MRSQGQPKLLYKLPRSPVRLPKNRNEGFAVKIIEEGRGMDAVISGVVVPSGWEVESDEW